MPVIDNSRGQDLAASNATVMDEGVDAACHLIVSARLKPFHEVSDQFIGPARMTPSACGQGRQQPLKVTDDTGP